MKNIIKEFYKFIKNDEQKEKVFSIFYNGKSLESLTYKEIEKCVSYYRKIIGTNNFSKRIGICIENSNDLIIGFMGILLNGYTVVGIDPLITKEGLEKIIKDNDLDCIFVNNKTDLSKFDNIKTIGTSIELENIDCKDDLKEISSNLNDIIVISYTSGTSGKFSKGVMVSNSNISFVSEEYNKIYKISSNSKIITVLPLWHNYAMFACLTNAMMGNAQIIIMDKWNLNNFLFINKKFKPDIFPGSPYMYIDIINADLDKIDISTLRICDSGGDSLPIECIKKFEEKTNAVITEGYGLTETISLTHFNYSAKERKIGSLGKCVTGAECKITDLEGNVIGKNKWGLLWIRGPMVFKGYVNNAELTKEVLKDGWFNTADIVREDDDGFFYIAGRFSDMKDYKENEITLREIENTLYKFAGIRRTFIKKKYNKEADFSSYDIYAILKNNFDITQLLDYIKKNLNNIVVDNVRIVEELPITGTGKIKRNRLGGENGTL